MEEQSFRTVWLAAKCVACNVDSMQKSFVRLILFGCLLVASATASASAESTGAKPLGNPSSWIRSNDYPPAALQFRAQGTTVFVLSVDTEGNVAGCNIVQSSGFPALDDATCDLMAKRAKFIPATDKDGHPALGSFGSSVHWLMPNTVYHAPTAGVVVERMIIELDGTPSNCKAAGAEVGGSQLVYRRCPEVHYAPYYDRAGRPVRKLVTVTSRTTVEDAPN